MLVGAAIAAGGTHVGTRNFLKFSRTQESAADQAALRYLEATGQSARGLVNFLKLLIDQDLLSASDQDPYARTHPFSRQRIDVINNHIKKSRFSNVPTSGDFKLRHRRMKAKLYAFLRSTAKTLRQYPESDSSQHARYARAIAYYKRPQLKRALPIIDGLIENYPDDPFFHEFKGQMLFENGRAEQALAHYERATSLLPTSALLWGELARVQLELGGPQLVMQSTVNFRAALDIEPRNAFYWRQLGIAYGKLNLIGKSALALSEEAILRKKFANAISLAERAKKKFPVGSPDWIRADDITANAKLRQK